MQTNKKNRKETQKKYLSDSNYNIKHRCFQVVCLSVHVYLSNCIHTCMYAVSDAFF